jgi:hypothetical protein
MSIATTLLRTGRIVLVTSKAGQCNDRHPDGNRGIKLIPLIRNMAAYIDFLRNPQINSWNP